LRQLPGLAVQRLMAEGYGFGAEGDWKTAILVRVANVMGSGLPGGASLMEDYTYDLVAGNERILGAHMLEVSPSLTTARPRLEVADSRRPQGRGLGGATDGRPGPGTGPCRSWGQGRPSATRLHGGPRPGTGRGPQRHAGSLPPRRQCRGQR